MAKEEDKVSDQVQNLSKKLDFIVKRCVRYRNIVFFVILLLIAKSVTGSARSTPTATFTHYGNIILAQDIVHVPVRVPMTAILKECETLAEEAKAVKATFNRPHDKMRMLTIGGAVAEVCGGFRAWQGAFEKERSKRGLLGVGLRVFRTIFGFLSPPRLKAIKEMARSVGWKHKAKPGAILKALEDIRKAMRGLEAKMITTARVPVPHRGDVPDLEKFFAVLQSLAELRGKTRRVVAGLMMARHGKLSAGLIDVPAAEKILAKVQDHLKQGRGRSGEKLAGMKATFLTPTELFDCPVSLTMEGEDPLVLIHVPIARQKARLFRYQTTPFAWTDEAKPERKLVLQVIEENWIVADAGDSIAAFRKEELRRCWKFRPQEWVCHHGIPLQAAPKDRCVQALYRSDTGLVRKACRLETIKDLKVVALKDAFVMFAPRDVSFEVGCPGKESSVEAAIAGLIERPLGPGCSVWSEDFHLHQPSELLAPATTVINLDWSEKNFNAATIAGMLKASLRLDRHDRELEALDRSTGLLDRDLQTSQYVGMAVLSAIIVLVLSAAIAGWARSLRGRCQKPKREEEDHHYAVLHPPAIYQRTAQPSRPSPAARWQGPLPPTPRGPVQRVIYEAREDLERMPNEPSAVAVSAKLIC